MLQRLTSLAAVVTLAAGCVAPVPRTLLDARLAVERAKSSTARDLAPEELGAAEAALARANEQYQQQPGSRSVADLAYIALRRAELAESKARQEVARAEKVRAEATWREAMARADVEQRARELAEAQRLEHEQLLAQRTAEAQRAQAQVDLEARVRDAESRAAEERRRSAEAQDALRKREAELEAERRARADAEQRAAAARESLASVANVKEDARGLVVTLSGSLLFRSGSAELLPSAKAKLDEVAGALKAANAPGLVVEGHTDSRGSPLANEGLSYRRAESVRNYLAMRGLPPDQIRVQGYGASRPVADNASAEGRANNRRVEIVVQRGGTSGVGGSGNERPAPPR